MHSGLANKRQLAAKTRAVSEHICPNMPKHSRGGGQSPLNTAMDCHNKNRRLRAYCMNSREIAIGKDRDRCILVFEGPARVRAPWLQSQSFMKITYKRSVKFHSNQLLVRSGWDACPSTGTGWWITITEHARLSFKSHYMFLSRCSRANAPLYSQRF